jgi:hypothetical protein
MNAAIYKCLGSDLTMLSDLRILSVKSGSLTQEFLPHFLDYCGNKDYMFGTGSLGSKWSSI